MVCLHLQWFDGLATLRSVGGNYVVFLECFIFIIMYKIACLFI